MIVFAILTFLLVISNEGLRAEERVSVMSYNLENLFDWSHDEGKNDLTFLPLADKQNPAHHYLCHQISQKRWRKQCLELDWSESQARNKMKNLAQVILSVNDGKGPDVLIIQEIENRKILEIFRKEFLAPAQYKTSILLEGRDKRGIDVGVLSRLQTAGKGKLHYTSFRSIDKKSAQDTRPILEVPLSLPNQTKLHIFGVHLPAPYHPWALRRESFEHLNSLANDLSPQAFAIAGGDFNVTSAEEKKQGLFKRLASTHWHVAFYMGCHDCRGTYYYAPRKQWSFLDSLIFRKKTASGWALDTNTVAVLSSKKQLNKQGFPISYNTKTKEGASDHLPIYAEIVLKSQ